MSMYSGLTRGKNGELLLNGKPHTVMCITGDDTPVKQDERADVDINKLVSNEMARQETIRIPGSADFADLTEYPETRGEAERRLRTVAESLQPHMLQGESLEEAMRRVMVAAAQVQASGRDSNAARADSSPPVPVTPAAASVPGPDSGPSKA